MTTHFDSLETRSGDYSPTGPITLVFDRYHNGFGIDVELKECRDGVMDLANVLTDAQRDRIEESLIEGDYQW